MVDVRKLELEDLYIIEERPLRVKIGRRLLFISPLPLRKVDKFEKMFADLLIKWRKYIGNIEILDYTKLKSSESVEAFAFLWKRLLKKEKKFLIDVCKLICEPYRFSVHYFMKRATYDVVTQCYLASQLINYDSVKKNIQFLLVRAGMLQAKQPLLATLQENMDGQKRRHLTPRY
jgi:hypothetical protein